MVTTKEKEVLNVIEKAMDYYNDGFSDVEFKHIVKETKMDEETVRGVLGSLIKKELVTFQEINHEHNIYYSTNWKMK